MLGHLFGSVVGGAIEVEGVFLSACIRLLIEAPVQIAQRIVVALGNALDKYREVESVPFGTEVKSEAVAG